MKTYIAGLVIGFVIGIAATSLVQDIYAAPERIQRKELTGISAEGARWAKKNFNPNGLLQERIEVIEVMLGLREAE